MFYDYILDSKEMNSNLDVEQYGLLILAVFHNFPVVGPKRNKHALS